jgi:uncharacterized membrane protein YkoI
MMAGLSRLAPCTAALALCLGVVQGARADDDDAHDHEQARRAVERGEALPLADIMAALEPRIDGEIVALEFEEEHGEWVYEVRYIDRAGRMVELYVDARTGTIRGVERD